MTLYFTSWKADLRGRLPNVCPERGCGQIHPHVCFASEPLPGQGQYVYRTEIPLAEVGKYEYRNDFRPSNVRYFALPLPLVLKHGLESDSYEALTGQPWNRWVIPVLDRRHKAKPNLRGTWTIVWASRAGIASVVDYEKIEEAAGHVTYQSVEVVATEAFDPAKDYLVAEAHEEYSDPYRKKETWNTRVVGGCTVPKWVIFPRRWTQYVRDHRVIASYVEFIRGIAPDTVEDMHYALRGGIHKSSALRAWWKVANEVGYALSRRFGTHIHLGKFNGRSWTQINAAPIRIAKRASQHLPPEERWVSPLPEPEYEDPRASGRYVLANPYGAHPTKGPGVDHEPQDRPYRQDIEGELEDEGENDLPFDDAAAEPLLVAR